MLKMLTTRVYVQIFQEEVHRARIGIHLLLVWVAFIQNTDHTIRAQGTYSIF